MSFIYPKAEQLRDERDAEIRKATAAGWSLEDAIKRADYVMTGRTGEVLLTRRQARRARRGK